MRTLHWRLNLGLGAILAAGFAVQWGLRGYAIPYIAEKQIVTRLHHDGEAILEELTFDRRGQLHLDMERQPPIYTDGHSGHYFLVASEGQLLKSPSLGESTLKVEELTPDQSRGYYEMGPERQPLLVLARGLLADDRPVTIVLGEDLTPLRRSAHEIGPVFLVLNGLFISLALIAQWFFVQRALKPFVILNRELAQMVTGEASRRTIGLPEAEEINRLIQLVDRRLERSRNAISNLAHGLKTPLAVLYRLADSPELAEAPRIRQSIKTNSGTIRDLVERELKRARLAGAGSVESQFNPEEDLKSLIEVLKAIYADKGLEFHIEAPRDLIVYDHQDMVELVGNLLDNASKWARHTVSLTIDNSRALRIRVEDDGPGCTDAELKRLGRRGVRLDETKEGHGLGLSIVLDIVKLYEGKLSFQRSAKYGGLAVSVTLPRPPTAAASGASG